MDLDDSQLLVRALEDADAFALFYRRHYSRVLAYFARRTGSPETAADLTAETFASALNGIRRYRPQRGPAVAWLFAIARNELVDAHRHGQVQDRARRRLKMEPLTLEDDDIEEIESRLSEASEVETLLAGLTDREREIVRRHVIEEQPYKDIADTLECSEAVVRKRLSRGLARLRSNLEEDS